MNAYELRQEARRERLERAATRAASESASRFQRARSEVEGIPLGQPILVGHHSEKRHRRALERCDTNMRKGVEAAAAARDLAHRAAAVGSGGISSDDPDAAVKLGEKVSELEARRDRMKAINAHWRKHKTFDGLELTDGERREIASNAAYSWQKTQPYPSYSLTNLGARIRDAKRREARMAERAQVVEALEADGAAPVSRTVNGATITEDVIDNRVLLAFPARLSREGYKQVRSYGFVWSPTRKAFVRKLGGNAIALAELLATRGVA